MDQHFGERGLALYYPLIIGLSFISSVTSAVAWSHWKSVLNPSVDRRDTNYGCFLYEVSITSYFRGGHSAYCHFAVYGLVLPGIFALVFGLYHVFRVCMGNGKRNIGTANIRQRTGEIIVVTAQSDVTDDGVSPYYWIPACVASVLMGLYTLVYASIYSDGLIHSCDQFRNELVKNLHASGRVVEVVQGRLSCSAVFDFMDYIHSDQLFGRQRSSRINSAACFYLALISSWLAVILWIIVCITNIRCARRSRTVRV